MDWLPWVFRIVPVVIALGSAFAVLRGCWLLVASSKWSGATATVTDVRTAYVGTGTDRRARFHAQIDFQTAMGQPQRAVVPFFSFLGMSPAIGAPIAVRYDPENPGRAVIDKLTTRGLPEIVGGLLVLAFAVFFYTIATPVVGTM